MKNMIFAALAVLGIALGAITMGNPAHADDGSQRNTEWIGSSGNG